MGKAAGARGGPQRGAGGRAPSFSFAAKPPGVWGRSPQFHFAAKPPPGSGGRAPSNRKLSCFCICRQYCLRKLAQLYSLPLPYRHFFIQPRTFYHISGCYFVNTLGRAYFLNSTLTCNQLNYGGLEQCPLASGNSILIDDGACNTTGGDFVIDTTDNGGASIDPTGTLTLTCSTSGVLSLSGNGIKTTSGITSIGCDSNYRIPRITLSFLTTSKK